MKQYQEKQTIRQQICTARSALTPDISKDAAIKMCCYVVNLPVFKCSKCIGLYWPQNGEMSTLPILEKAIALNKSCYLPILHPAEQHGLLFMPYNQNTVLKPNKYNIPEPEFHNNYEQTLAINELSIVFIPLVAFDSKGYRLGMGKGYYDATLAKVHKLPRQSLYIGLGYAMQEVALLPREHWDLPLDGVITEVGTKTFNQAKFDTICTNK